MMLKCMCQRHIHRQQMRAYIGILRSLPAYPSHRCDYESGATKSLYKQRRVREIEKRHTLFHFGYQEHQLRVVRICSTRGNRYRYTTVRVDTDRKWYS